MATDLFTFGETMLRLGPPANVYIEQTDYLEMRFGGTMSNVAINLARLGLNTTWYTKLPDNPIGHACLRDVRGHGVNTTLVDFAPDARMGVYFIEYGEEPRGIRVIYDRKHSAASTMTPDALPLEQVKDARWFHLNGITAALSENCHDTVTAAVDFANANNIPLSFDVNYRSLLWSPQVAAERLNGFCEKADMVFMAFRDAINLWGAPDNIEDALKVMHDKWGGKIVMTNGGDGGCAYDGSQIYTTKSVPVTIVDRIGAGDGFASGILYALLHGKSLDIALDYGAALAALALTTQGDTIFCNRDDLENLVKGQAAAGLTR